MPLLTAAIIICGALPQPGSPLACRAQIYHGIVASQSVCVKAATSKARATEANLAKSGQLVRTSSHAECFSADDEGSVVFYLPEFMRVQLGAETTRVVHYRVSAATLKEIGL